MRQAWTALVPMVRPFQAARRGRAAAMTSDLITPGPARHSNFDPTEKGPWVTTDFTPGIHLGHDSTSVSESQTASAGAARFR